MCKHLNFETESKVFRMTNEKDNSIEFRAEIKIRCSDCKINVEFEGIEGGFISGQPTVSVCNTELRLALNLPQSISDEA